MIHPLDEIKALLQDLEDSKRIIICAPDDQLVCEVATAGIPTVTVQVNPLLTKGTVYIVDPNALEASRREALQQSLRQSAQWLSSPLWPSWLWRRP